jgi:hypothetical protein
MKKTVIVLSLFVVSLSCARLAGTNDETSIRTGAVIYEPDGRTPADNATVKIFRADAVDGRFESIQTTASDGRFSLAGLPKGAYNVWAQKDSLVVFQSPVIISETDTIIKNDTLSCPSIVTGIVGVQPQDDPRTVTIRVVGLDKYFDNTDKDGWFTMKNMARGTYALLLTSTEEHYTPTKVEISLAACAHDTLDDSLHLTYTGIPIVTGLKASYDTANGIARLTWNATTYRGFQNYCIFRDFYDSAAYSTKPLAAVGDTIFVDRIFNPNAAAGRFSFSDTNDYHFRYRLAIRDMVSAIGPTFKSMDIVAASPSKVQSVFFFSSRHIAKGYRTTAFVDSSAAGKVKITGRASINDSLVIIAHVSSRSRGLARLEWRDSGGSVDHVVNLDSTRMNAVDSIICRWTNLGMHAITCTVIDNAGSTWTDTARIEIMADAPKINLFVADSPAICTDPTKEIPLFAIGDSIPLHLFATDSFGSIVSIQWGFGLTAATASKTMTTDTFATAPDTMVSRYPLMVTVSDDDGNMVSDTVRVDLNLFAPATCTAAFKPRMYQSGIVFDNKMWVFGGVGIAQETPRTTFTSLNDAWVSENGRTWIQKATNAPARSGHAIVAFNGKLWLIGGYASSWGKYKNDVWCSPDGVSWTCVTDSAAFSPRIYHCCMAFKNKLWVISGLTRISQGTGIITSHSNDVWSSADGITWEKATDTALFPPRCYHSSLVYDDKLWVIGGRDSLYNPLNDVWYSSDGAAWTMATFNADFSPRQGHTGLVYGNKLWVIGGYGFDASDMAKDIWNSTDGAVWKQATDSTCFIARAFHSTLVFRNRLWVIAGMTGNATLANDVWRSGALVK